MKAWLRCWAAAAVLAPLLACAQPVPEYDLKAAVVYNFMRFTEWPADTAYEGGGFNICVHPGSPLRVALGNVAEKSLKGRPILVRPLAQPDLVRYCHVLLIDAADRNRWRTLRQAVAGLPVLTIAEDSAGEYDGSIITLAIEHGRIVFDVDTRAARQANLAISSKLLRLARTVQ